MRPFFWGAGIAARAGPFWWRDELEGGDRASENGRSPKRASETEREDWGTATSDKVSWFCSTLRSSSTLNFPPRHLPPSWLSLPSLQVCSTPAKTYSYFSWYTACRFSVCFSFSKSTLPAPFYSLTLPLFSRATAFRWALSLRKASPWSIIHLVRCISGERHSSPQTFKRDFPCRAPNLSSCHMMMALQVDWCLYLPSYM